MKTKLFTIIFTLFAVALSAQTPKNAKSVNSDKLIKQGIELFDKQEYKKAADLFIQVPMGDSLYALAQYELAYAYEALEEYDKGIAILKELIEDNGEEISQSGNYTLLGTIYSEKGSLDEAIAVFEKALLIYPHNNQLWFNRGVVHLKKSEYAIAADCFQQAIFANPTHQTSHFRLGVAYLSMGLTAQGIMAIDYAIIINPKSRTAISCLQLLENMYKSGITEMFPVFNKELPEHYAAEKKRLYKLDAILKANMYNQKGFRAKSDINHPIVKQNQIIFENVEALPNSTDVVNFLYIPYFKSLMVNKNDFNTFSYLMFSGTNLEGGKIEKKALKMISQLNVLVEYSTDLLEEKAKLGIGQDAQKTFNYFYNDKFFLTAFGKLVGTGEDALLEGWFTHLNSYGGIVKKEFFVNGVTTDTTRYFYEDGTIEQMLPVKNGEIHGQGYLYAPNYYPNTSSIIGIAAHFEEGNYDGAFKRYNRSGILIEESNYSAGLLQGEDFEYYSQGTIARKASYLNNNLHGTVIEFYSNGDTSEIAYYPPIENANLYYAYYHDGKLSYESQMENGQLSGAWKRYFHNGNVSASGFRNSNGSSEGKKIDYFENGQIATESYYINGKLDGELIRNDISGKRLLKEVYEKDIIQQAIIYNLDGTEKETISLKNNQLEFVLHDEYGLPLEKFSYRYKDTNEWGTRTFYWSNGTIEQTLSYVNNKKNGERKYYYANGKLNNYYQYKDDLLNGLCISYYQNDTISEEGYYTNDRRVGIWYSYFPDGKIQDISIYNHTGDKLSGTYYFNDGTREMERVYRNNMPYIYTFYNDKDEVLKSDTFNFGNGERKYYYLNGNLLSKVKMVAGKDVGKQTLYTFFGDVLTENNYIEDELDGEYTRYTLSDQLSSRRYYVGGMLHGKQYNYYRNGALSSETDMVYDNIKVFKEYYLNGNKMSEINYLEGDKEGIANYYALDGSLAYQIRYHRDRLVEYAYMDKDGKMTQFYPYQDKFSFTSYYKNGKISFEINYENGLLHGDFTAYHPNGNKQKYEQYYYSLSHGKYNFWHENGKISRESYYVYDELDGDSKRYYDNGQLEIETFYVQGKEHGTTKYYDKAGKLIRSQEVFYGELIGDVKY